MSWGWIPLIWVALMVLLAGVLQVRTRRLISALKTDEALYRQAGSPRADYVWLSLLCHRYQHLLNWVVQNRQPPPQIAAAVPDYAHIRSLSRILRALEWGFVGYLVGHFLLRLLLHIYE
ncbi:hypothetical protein AB8Q18_09415 [Neisseriaceae bacterium CLB008]|nr:hypothetical protein [Neisseriaceae bacterium]